MWYMGLFSGNPQKRAEKYLLLTHEFVVFIEMVGDL